MTTEVSVAVVVGLFTMFLVFAFAMGAIRPLGMKTIMGNREDVPPLTGWVGRAQRAHQNALENLLPYAVVAFALQAADVSTWLSQTAALVFLGARITHGLSYLAGIQGVRTLSWNVGFAATVAAAIPLLGLLRF